MEETIHYIEHLSKKKLTDREVKRLTILLDNYKKLEVIGAFEKTYKINGRIFFEYAEAILNKLENGKRVRKQLRFPF